MEIDHYMANLFFEIRRSLPASQQSSMKISASDLGARMVDLYESTNDENIKGLIEAFLEHAGAEWSKKIEVKTKRYRGAELSMEDSRQPGSDERTKKKVRYYRGARIEE